jgi:hypothetical protein
MQDKPPGEPCKQKLAVHPAGSLPFHYELWKDPSSFTFGTMDINFNANQQLRKVLQM